MPTRLRKTRKLRGSRTHGWGVSGQHRKSARTAGHGKSGWCKHKWTYFVKYHVKYPLKKDKLNKGFKCPTSHTLKNINLSQLEDLVYRLENSGKPLNKIKNKYLIDLTELGYGKILGKGRVTASIIVSVSSYSELAKRKIEDVGGTINLKPKVSLTKTTINKI